MQLQFVSEQIFVNCEYAHFCDTGSDRFFRRASVNVFVYKCIANTRVLGTPS